MCLLDASSHVGQDESITSPLLLIAVDTRFVSASMVDAVLKSPAGVLASDICSILRMYGVEDNEIESPAS